MRCDRRARYGRWFQIVVVAVLAGGAAGLGGCAAIEPFARPWRAPGLPLPRQYVCLRIDSAPTIDGRVDDAAWHRARWSDPFVDIQGGDHPAPRFLTRMKMVWDDHALYVAAEMEEPHVWGTLTERDQIVFHDNDFEVFIDPDGDGREYYEVEVNALDTIFDLFLPRTYIAGGKADHGWNLAGLETAVHVDGTLNDPSDTDTGWTVEIKMPWAAIGEHANRPEPPGEGDAWRINFSRVEWRHRVVDGRYEKVPNTPEDNWVWSPQGVINMHVPRHWGYVVFRGGR